MNKTAEVNGLAAYANRNVREDKTTCRDSESEIRSALESINKLICGMGERLYQLDEKLSPVLKPNYPDGGVCGAGGDEPARSPLSEELRAVAGNLHAHLLYINSIHDRIDL